MLRFRTGLNFGWRYTPDYSPAKSKNETFDFSVRPVDIPHNSGSGKLHYFSGEDDSKIVQYSKLFVVPDEMEGKRVFLHFDGVMSCAAVFVNDKPAFAHKGGFTGFGGDITELLTDSENKLTVIVDSSERADTPPYGAPVDFLSYGGIYREVWLEAVPTLYIKDTFINPMFTEKGWKLDITGEIGGEGGERKLTFSLYDGSKRLGSCQYKAEQPNYHVSWTVSADVTPWTPETPKLYTFKVTLSSGDELDYTIGFRQVKVDGQGFLLNGKRMKLLGINRLQNYAHEGFAMPASAQRSDADLIKSLGCNAVRTARYPQSGAFIERCNEIGLMVIADMPGYQHMESGEWLDTLVENVRETVLARRNDPCIIMWGTRPDDTRDDARINRKICDTVRSLDTSRPMYGVRCFKGSDLLEEVYGYNDGEIHPLHQPFTYDTAALSLGKSPVMITEHTGALYPARSFGGERELLEQALAHARVIDAAYGGNEIIGAFGWCLNDYNAHPSFGGNDGVCASGICDINRVPKLAAAVYQSQTVARPFLEISSAMMAGEHRLGVIGQVYAFTNCDSVRLYKNDEPVAEFFPDRGKYPFMPHPPILIDDLIGKKMAAKEGFDERTEQEIRSAMGELGEDLPAPEQTPQPKTAGLMSLFRTAPAAAKVSEDEALRLYETYAISRRIKTVFRFEGIIDGKAAVTVVKEPVSKAKLKVNVSGSKLIHGDTYDAARIEIVAVDTNDNRLSYYTDCLEVSVDGAIEVVGPSIIPLMGGSTAFYVRTKGGRKQANVKITTQSMGEFTIPLSVVRKTAKELNVSRTEEPAESQQQQ
ncbi:MAG: hypothetical protein IIY93_07245 [Clostridia bacterium]|nr:hypothetical protein [Clostridia bacterium]